MTYGLQLYDATGALRLDTDETFTRVVAVEKRDASFSGTISVPDFDDTRGMFHVNYLVNKVRLDLNTIVADSTDPMAQFYGMLAFEITSLPTLSWNNSTKVLTVSPVSWPGGWTRFGPSDYVITFIHFR